MIRTDINQSQLLELFGRCFTKPQDLVTSKSEEVVVAAMAMGIPQEKAVPISEYLMNLKTAVGNLLDNYIENHINN